mmetsp:Transcript_18669/g.56383  ORF Transcript_18669/g.56383 Transcript_18669/m.56383 type:complete len:86 (-) Transcript_18669:108-365(-)
MTVSVRCVPNPILLAGGTRTHLHLELGAVIKNGGQGERWVAGIARKNDLHKRGSTVLLASSWSVSVGSACALTHTRARARARTHT